MGYIVYCGPLSEYDDDIYYTSLSNYSKIRTYFNEGTHVLYFAGGKSMTNNISYYGGYEVGDSLLLEFLVPFKQQGSLSEFTINYRYSAATHKTYFDSTFKNIYVEDTNSGNINWAYIALYPLS